MFAAAPAQYRSAVPYREYLPSQLESRCRCGQGRCHRVPWRFVKAVRAFGMTGIFRTRCSASRRRSVPRPVAGGKTRQSLQRVPRRSTGAAQPVQGCIACAGRSITPNAAGDGTEHMHDATCDKRAKCSVERATKPKPGDRPRCNTRPFLAHREERRAHRSSSATAGAIGESRRAR